MNSPEQNEIIVTHEDLFADVVRDHSPRVADDVRKFLLGDHRPLHTGPPRRDADGFVIMPDLSYAALIGHLATLYLQRVIEREEGAKDMMSGESTYVPDQEFEAFIANASDEVKELARARFYHLPEPERPKLPLEPVAHKYVLRVRGSLGPVREAQALVLAFYTRK